MRLLFSSQSAPEVGLLKNLLEENGIVAEVRNETVHSNFPGAAFQPEVWIMNDKDFLKACEVRDAWHQPAPARNPVAPEDSESRGALWLVCVVCFGGGIVSAWQGFRARSWAHFLVTGFLLSMVAVIYNVIRHLPPPRRSRKPRTS
jgi:hypothetical protein